MWVHENMDIYVHFCAFNCSSMWLFECRAICLFMNMQVNYSVTSRFNNVSKARKKKRIRLKNGIANATDENWERKQREKLNEANAYFQAKWQYTTYKWIYFLYEEIISEQTKEWRQFLKTHSHTHTQKIQQQESEREWKKKTQICFVAHKATSD